MFCESWGVCDFPDPEGRMPGLPAKRQWWQQWASCLALPKALPATAGGQVVLEKTILCVTEPPPQRPSSLFTLDKKKNVAVTLVSGSDDIFSSLSSNGAERSGTFKTEPDHQKGFRWAALWCGRQKRVYLHACCCFDDLSAWPGFISVAYQIQATITDSEISIHDPTCAFLSYRKKSKRLKDWWYQSEGRYCQRKSICGYVSQALRTPGSASRILRQWSYFCT